MYHFSKISRLRLEKHRRVLKGGQRVRHIVVSVPLGIEFMREAQLDPFAEYEIGYTAVVKGRAGSITLVKRDEP